MHTGMHTDIHTQAVRVCLRDRAAPFAYVCVHQMLDTPSLWQKPGGARTGGGTASAGVALAASDDATEGSSACYC
jgi:hypothetical protein